jgi:hypothetical protein
MNAQNTRATGSWSRSRLLHGGIAAGAAAVMLASAAVATAAPAPTAPQAHAAHAAIVASAAAKPYSSVTVNKRVVRGGQRVTVSGNAPKNARAGKWITLTSDAFASKTTVNGIPAIRTQVLVNGKYSATATIRRGLKPTNYAVSGSFDGRPLDTVAWMTVRGR